MKQLRETSYLTILRPTLEYAAMVCDPTTQTLIQTLENVQVILENSDITKRPWQRLAIGDNWNRLMRLRDMKYIGFKYQRESKQNSDKY
jgi:hypothetical protein